MKLVTLGIMILASLATAHETDLGRIEIVGKGIASAAPEYATISVSVISICYDHSRDAKNANAELANTLLTILKKYQRGPKDKVTASGGPNVRETVYLEP